MGNIVSNIDLPGQTPAVLATAVSISVPQSAEITPVSSEQIKTGYGVDPFGPMAQPQQQAIPDIGQEPPSITPDLQLPVAEPPAITQPEQLAQVNNVVSAATLMSNMPSIEQMMKDLERSGCLMPDLHVKTTRKADSSPLAALQPQRLKDKGTYFDDPSVEPAKPLLPEVQLATTYVARTNTVVSEKHELPLFVLIAIIGVIQVIQGAAQVVHFILVRYPQYEQLVIFNQLTTTEINATVINGILIGVLAVITLLTTLVVSVGRVKNHSPILYVSVALIVLNYFVQNVMAGSEFVSGSPLTLPVTLSEIISSR